MKDKDAKIVQQLGREVACDNSKGLEIYVDGKLILEEKDFLLYGDWSIERSVVNQVMTYSKSCGMMIPIPIERIINIKYKK